MANSTEQHQKPPPLNFKYDSNVAKFAVSQKAYLATHSDGTFDHIATGSLVLVTTATSAPRILLLQRAASDSHPNKWEPPGGACDDEDETILYGAARELWEEAGLVATFISGPVGEPNFFTTRNGRNVCRFHFAVGVDSYAGVLPAVQLDPNEHQSFVWASEDEVKARKVGGVELEFTRDNVEQTVHQAFVDFHARK
ncbi:NUDIX hydrolase domain-like protein [Acrodontium crateriforme]|uniref:NUDIX hydrolase domain-like protein n=1 Tax=Acrodontium crateriforme TaxID=150365 RepID=A0AAQ3M0N8_9PEZI|nr:NUDIX hydrolase domain-like protein [Acrodontium crateriforme]